jgi:predicted ferric reductase
MCFTTALGKMLQTLLSFYFFKKLQMGNLLYIIAVVMIIFWAIGFFAYSAGSIIHILLVIAAISILLKLIKGEKVL